MSTDEDEWIANLTYREACGLASELARVHRQGRDWQSDPTASILAGVVRRMAPFGEELDPAFLELVREAVDDAVAQRRPRW
jgi:hypothetical protein